MLLQFFLFRNRYRRSLSRLPGRLFRCNFFHGWRGNFNSLGSESLSESIRQPVLDGVGVRRHGHTHVLQLTNHFGVVEVQLTRELIDSKFLCHESLFLPLILFPWSVCCFIGRRFRSLFGWFVDALRKHMFRSGALQDILIGGKLRVILGQDILDLFHCL